MPLRFFPGPMAEKAPPQAPPAATGFREVVMRQAGRARPAVSGHGLGGLRPAHRAGDARRSRLDQPRRRGAVVAAATLAAADALRAASTRARLSHLRSRLRPNRLKRNYCEGHLRCCCSLESSSHYRVLARFAPRTRGCEAAPSGRGAATAFSNIHSGPLATAPAPKPRSPPRSRLTAPSIRPLP